MDALKRLQDLFGELFQLDLADLDFGLYRLFHLKRVEIEAFLNEQLSRRVREAFQDVAGDEARNIQAEISALAERICREVDDGAICSDGEIHAHPTNLLHNEFVACHLQ